MDEDKRNSPWNVIKRIIAGKPAFLTIDAWKDKVEQAKDPLKWKETSDKLKEKASSALQTPARVRTALSLPKIANPLRDAKGNKIIPEIQYVRFSDHISGEQLDLWLLFRNISNVTIEIQYAELFGQRSQICEILQPNELEKVLAYSGIMPTSTSQVHGRIVYCELLSGRRDVFCAEYIVQFLQYHDTHHYTIHGLMKNGPTRDW